MLATQELRGYDLPALGLAVAALVGAVLALFIPIGAGVGLVIAACCGIGALLLLLFASAIRYGAIAAYAAIAALIFSNAQSDIGRDERAWLARNDPDTAIVAFRGVVAFKEESGNGRVERLWCEQVRLELLDTSLTARHLQVRLTVPLAAGNAIEIGDALAGNVQIESAHERYQRSVRDLMWSLRTMNWADARLVDESNLIVVPGRRGIRAIVHDARASILHELSLVLAPDAAAVAGALLIGSREQIASGFRSDLQLSGLAHLFALSGLNTGLIVSLCWIIMAWLFVPRRVRYAVLLVVLLGYTVLGLSVPSLFRSAVMAGLWIIGRLLAKSSHPANLLLFAFALELYIWPLHLLDAGFLLSYLSMAGILAAYVAFMKPFQDLIASGNLGFRRRLADTLSSTIGAQLATAPVAGMLFSRVPGVAILANIVAIPAFSLLVVLILLLLALSPLHSGIAGPIARAIEAIVWGFAGMSSFLAELPGAGFSTSSSSWFAVVAFAVQCAAITLLLRARRSAGVLLTLISVNLLLWPAHFGGRVAPTIKVLGSEQSSIVLFTNGEFACLTGFGSEAGSDRNASLIEEAIDNSSVVALNAVIIPSEKANVIGGAPTILERVPVQVVLDFSQPRETMTASTFRAALFAKEIPVQSAKAGDVLEFENSKIEILWPPSTEEISGCAWRVMSNGATFVQKSGMGSDCLYLFADLIRLDSSSACWDCDNLVMQIGGYPEVGNKTWVWDGASWEPKPSRAELLMRLWSLPGNGTVYQRKSV